MSELRVVEQFRGELLSATVPRRRRPRWLLGGIGAVVLVTGIASAAAGSFPIGDPLGPWHDSGAGTPVPHSDHLQAIRAADPAGGPPWGIRVFRTAHSPGPPPRIGDPRRSALLHRRVRTARPSRRRRARRDRDRRPLPRAAARPGGGVLVQHRREPRVRGTDLLWLELGQRHLQRRAGQRLSRPTMRCGGTPRWVMGGAAKNDVAAVELAGRRYPLVDGRFLIVLTDRPHAHLMYVMRDGRVTKNPLVRR